MQRLSALPRRLRHAWTLVLLCTALSSCAAGGPVRSGPRLSPDSAAVLRRALERARPAFGTQEEALRAGVYAAAVAPLERPGEPGSFVIQIAALGDPAAARAAAVVAEAEFAQLSVRVEPGGGVHRVLLVGWSDRKTAEAALARVRARYPEAWLRQRPLP